MSASSSSAMRQIKDFMRSSGYEVLRQRGPHIVWSNGRHRVVTPKSPSDHRAFLNIRSYVRQNSAAAPR